MKASPLPSAVLRGFPIVVYHWTTRANAEAILRSGLRRRSYVTPDPRHYKGDVLLGVCMAKAHAWTSKDRESDWQAVLPERVPPARIFVVKYGKPKGAKCGKAKK
jgi:hypothetical protein